MILEMEFIADGTDLSLPLPNIPLDNGYFIVPSLHASNL